MASGEHYKAIPRTHEKSITLVDTPYTLPLGYNQVKVDTTGGNVRVNLPNVNYPIDVIKTSSDSYIVTVWVAGVQKATVAGPMSKITIENAEVTKDEPWYPYDAIVGIAGVSGDGGEVLAKDRYGRVIASGVAGTDDAAIINAVYALLASGGSVLLCNGNYIAEETISPSSYTRLSGQNTRKTIITAKNGLNADVISTYAASANGTDFCHCIEIENLTVEGNKNNQTAGNCIYFVNQKYSRIENCYIDHAYEAGIKIYGNAPLGKYADLTNILYNRIYNSKLYGIYMAGYTYGHRLVGNTLASNILYGCSDAGLYVIAAQECHFMQNNCHGNLVGMYINYVTSAEFVQNHSEDNQQQGVAIVGSEGYPAQLAFVANTVRRNSLESPGSYSNLKLDWADHCVVSNNILYYDNVTPCHSYAIDETATCTYNKIENNMIDVSETNRLLGDKKFKNWGSSTGTGAVQAIAHKLCATPTKVVITIPTRNYTGGCTVSSTNLYPEIQSGTVYNWYAEVDSI